MAQRTAQPQASGKCLASLFSYLLPGGELNHPTGAQQGQVAHQGIGATVGDKEHTSPAALSTGQHGQHLSEEAVSDVGAVVGQAKVRATGANKGRVAPALRTATAMAQTFSRDTGDPQGWHMATDQS